MARHVIRRITNFLPLMVIKFYRLCISPLMPPACRFSPSCSTYGLQAFQKHPFHKAAWLTCWRILRCNPFNEGGFDPVPPGKGDAPCCGDSNRDAAGLPQESTASSRDKRG